MPLVWFLNSIKTFKFKSFYFIRNSNKLTANWELIANPQSPPSIKLINNPHFINEVSIWFNYGIESDFNWIIECWISLIKFDVAGLLYLRNRATQQFLNEWNQQLIQIKSTNESNFLDSIGLIDWLICGWFIPGIGLPVSSTSLHY